MISLCFVYPVFRQNGKTNGLWFLGVGNGMWVNQGKQILGASKLADLTGWNGWWRMAIFCDWSNSNQSIIQAAKTLGCVWKGARVFQMGEVFSEFWILNLESEEVVNLQLLRHYMLVYRLYPLIILAVKANSNHLYPMNTKIRHDNAKHYLCLFILTYVNYFWFPLTHVGSKLGTTQSSKSWMFIFSIDWSQVLGSTHFTNPPNQG